MRNFKGSKLEETRNLNTTEIAKLIRKDIKAAKKAGLPVGKVSVRTSYYAGGSSIDVEVKSLHPVAGPLFTVDSALMEMDGCSVYWGDQQSATYKRIMDTLNGIMGQYNWDNSDSMTDYFDVRFYGHAEFSHELREAELQRAKDEAAKVRAHEAEHEHGQEWVQAYWMADGKREMAGWAVAEFKDAVNCLDADEYAEHLGDLRLKAEDAVAEMDAARKEWEAAVSRGLEAENEARRNAPAVVISEAEILAAAEPDERPVVEPDSAPSQRSGGSRAFDAISVNLETGDISYPAIPGFELDMDAVYRSARLFAPFAPSAEAAVKHAIHEQLSAYRGLRSLVRG